MKVINIDSSGNQTAWETPHGKRHDSGAAPIALANKIRRWNYDKSVEKMRPLVRRWKHSTIEILRELYLAREFLTHQKGQHRNPEADDYLSLSWGGYCGEIGLSYQTANNWLRNFQFVPREISPTGKDALLLLEAPPKEDTAAARALLLARVSEFLRTGDRPTGWSAEEEAELARQLKNAEIARLAEKYNAPAVSKTKDYFSEIITRKSVVNFKLKDNAQIQAQAQIFRYIEAYLATFDPDSRLRASFNLALKARNIANEVAEAHYNSGGEAGTE